ncbi:hypothetical protein, partial [uncultured Sphingobium sp.]|uniref:hypothetical protein n=1 Tax=uncultured Sphingobium sp. TaxID=316087 RepID=UPI00258B28DE
GRLHMTFRYPSNVMLNLFQHPSAPQAAARKEKWILKRVQDDDEGGGSSYAKSLPLQRRISSV